MADRLKPVLRDSSGHYALGTRGGPGRPTLKRETEYLRVMTDECTVEQWRDITRKAVTQAIEDGNWRARDWLTKYLIGPAITAVQTQIVESVDPLTGDLVKELSTLIAHVYGGVLPAGDSDV